MGDQRAKADAGKAKISLVPPQIIYDIAEVREYGNRKYGDPDNWKTVEPERYIDAFLRHALAMIDDPAGKDEESGIEHYKHCACNLAFLCVMLKKEYSLETAVKEFIGDIKEQVDKFNEQYEDTKIRCRLGRPLETWEEVLEEEK